MEISVYENRVEEVVKTLSRLQRKAEKYHISFHWQQGEPHQQIVKVYRKDWETGGLTKINEFLTQAVTFVIDDEIIQNSGWVLIAKIEHSKDGNIVTNYGECAPDKSWYTISPQCDHCKIDRFRNTTFIVKNSDGDLKQVGSSCLKDYTGIDPYSSVLWAKVRDMEDGFEFAGGNDNEWAAFQHLHYFYNVEDVVAIAYDQIKANGYRRSNEAGSTKDEVIYSVTHGENATKEAKEKAKEIIEWIKTLDYDTSNDFERKVIVIVNGGLAKVSNMGLLAYMPIAYKKWLEQQEEKKRKEENKKLTKDSVWIGTVGDRQTFEIKGFNLVSSWDNDWGTTWLYKFIDYDNNVLIWYASSPIDEEEVKQVKGTIKAHSEYDGIKQTVINRCKVIGVKHKVEVEKETPSPLWDDPEFLKIFTSWMD